MSPLTLPTPHPPAVRRVARWIVLALAAAPALAQVPADSLFREFQPTRDFVFALAGKTLDDAEVYHSDRAAAFLVLAPELASPLLINPRAGTVESVHLMKVAKRPDGTVDLLADATLQQIGPFQLVDQEVRFTVSGKAATLKQRPWLLGEQEGASIEAYDPAYTTRAAAYDPAADALRQLRATDQEVRVRIYFGSWCPHCQHFVPYILSVEKALRGSKIHFEYYGLPSPLSDDPVTEKLDIRGVPTAIVYSGGKEIGRLTNNDWKAPEGALVQLVRKASHGDADASRSGAK